MLGGRVLVLLLITLYGGAWGQYDFDCPFPTGLFPDPDPAACSHFYQCDHGIVYLKFCPSGSLFDAHKKFCVDRHLPVACGPHEPTEAPEIVVDLNVALPCDVDKCQLPYCFCSPDSTAIPGNLTRTQVPQIIMITFDAGVNHLNFDTYNTIFLDNRTNPNGCPIRATFFMSHDYTNYQLVQDFYSKGHEMATGSVTRRAGLEDEDEEGWVGEMVSQREILRHWASVDPNDVIGMRAPHLKPGRNAQYQVLTDYGYVYDSSVTAPPKSEPMWPYTLDYAISHECKAHTCPTHPFPGVWELPINSHYSTTVLESAACPYLDQCALIYLTEAEVTQWLKEDLHRHYDGNRAPYQLSLTINWFHTKTLHNGLLAFIDYTLTLPDLYYTTMTEALHWVSDPVPLKQMGSYGPWDCTQKTFPKPPCARPNSCTLPLDPAVAQLYGRAGGVRYMLTCESCPNKFPFIYDAAGNGLGQDVYEKAYFVEQ